MIRDNASVRPALGPKVSTSLTMAAVVALVVVTLAPIATRPSAEAFRTYLLKRGFAVFEDFDGRSQWG